MLYKEYKKAGRFFRILLFACTMAVCMVLGVAPVIPQRKDDSVIEMQVKETENKEASVADYTARE